LRVMANGRPVELREGARLPDLFEELGVGARWVVAEVNGTAVERRVMETLELADGDRVEVVRAVAGG
jgi:sulfur carrier protein